MTPEKREQLTKQLADHGLTVLLTRDFDSILIQLARLIQFERLMIQVAAGNPAVEFAVDHVLREQADLDTNRQLPEPMADITIPWALQAVNAGLQQLLDNCAAIHPERLPAAVAAFVGMLRAEGGIR